MTLCKEGDPTYTNQCTIAACHKCVLFLPPLPHILLTLRIVVDLPDRLVPRPEHMCSGLSLGMSP